MVLSDMKFDRRERPVINRVLEYSPYFKAYYFLLNKVIIYHIFTPEFFYYHSYCRLGTIVENMSVLHPVSSSIEPKV